MWQDRQRLAIIADDLTGSCDTAAQFSRFGLPTFVSHLPSLAAEKLEPIFVVNTGTRKLRAVTAMRTVGDTARQLMASGRTVFFKKIDSTLKGNWAAEIITLSKIAHPPVVLIAPAFPEWGRTTVQGIQLFRGTPVSETGLARRHSQWLQKASMVSNLVSSLHEQSEKRTHLISEAIIRKGPQRIEQAIKAARSKGARFIVFDATCDNDLRNISLGGCRLEEEPLWVGSAGLARFLPLGWGCQPTSVEIFPDGSAKPSLLINGSLHPSNGRQLEILAEKRAIYCLILEDEDQPSGDKTQSKLAGASEALKNSVDVAISLRLNRGIQSLSQLQQLHTVLQWCSGELIRQSLVGGTLIVGGETAAKIYQDIGAKGIHLQGEVHPGVPIGCWEGGILDQQLVVTKAGGFGHEDTLVRAMECLRGRSIQLAGDAKELR
jgi:uncharacterized protein YgbK (DUF1537 family)